MLIGIIGILITIVSLIISSEFRKSRLSWVCGFLCFVVGICIVWKHNVDRDIIKENEIKRATQHIEDSISFKRNFDELLSSQNMFMDNIGKIKSITNIYPFKSVTQEINNNEKPLLIDDYQKFGPNPIIWLTDTGYTINVILTTIDEHRAENIKTRWTLVTFGIGEYQTNGYTKWVENNRVMVFEAPYRTNALRISQSTPLQKKLPRKIYFVLEVSYTNSDNKLQKIFRGIYPITKVNFNKVTPKIPQELYNEISDFLEKPHKTVEVFEFNTLFE